MVFKFKKSSLAAKNAINGQMQLAGCNSPPQGPHSHYINLATRQFSSALYVVFEFCVVLISWLKNENGLSTVEMQTGRSIF